MPTDVLCPGKDWLGTIPEKVKLGVPEWLRQLSILVLAQVVMSWVLRLSSGLSRESASLLFLLSLCSTCPPPPTCVPSPLLQIWP